MDRPRTYLLIANQTLDSPTLHAWVKDTLAEGPCAIHVVVPATPVKRSMTWTEGQAIAVAEEQLEQALSELRVLGAEADGEVGDADPVLAAQDALRDREFDAVVISTLAQGTSRWLRTDAVTRLERSVDVPVIHLATNAAATADR